MKDLSVFSCQIVSNQTPRRERERKKEEKESGTKRSRVYRTHDGMQKKNVEIK